MITISYSEVRLFKECRRKYWFRYIEGLQPLQVHEALATGSEFHDKIAQVLKTGAFTATGDKTDSMVTAWQRYIMPVIEFRDNPEKFIKVQIEAGVELIGYVDGEATDGLQVEHKTTGYAIDDKYIHRLAWDEQIPTYLIASGNTEMWYTVIQKPSIRQKQNESLEEYLSRCVSWYDDNTESKVKIFKVHRQKEDVEAHQKNLVTMAYEIAGCENYYANPSACSIMGCPYESICLNYDPKFTIGFEKKERHG